MTPLKRNSPRKCSNYYEKSKPLILHSSVQAFKVKQTHDDAYDHCCGKKIVWNLTSRTPE